MKILLTGGTGYIGRRLVAALGEDGHECVVVTRRAPPGAAGHTPVRFVEADPARRGAWQDEVAAADAVINLAGARLVEPPQRWTTARKRVIWDSRIRTTEHLAEAIARAERPPGVLLSGSAVGYYGDRGDTPLDEGAEPGNDFLAKLCVAWEAAARDVEDRTRVVLLRTGLVLGWQSPVLAPMLPPFKLGLGGPWGSGAQWWPWIHVDDVVGLTRWALAGDARGPLNVTAPNPVRVRDFARELGQALHRPAIARIPAFALRLALGELADALLASQRVTPAKATAAGYRFVFPDLAPALRQSLVKP